MLRRQHPTHTVIATALGLLVCSAGAGHAAGVKWLDAPGERPDWELAQERAKRTNEPVMAYVYVQNMSLCQMMEVQTFRSPVVGKLSEKFLCAKVDALELDNQRFMTHYGVARQQDDRETDRTRSSLYPQTLFLSPDGRLAHMVFGFVTPDEFATVMEQCLELIDVLEKLDEDAPDAGRLAKLGGLYVAFERYSEAREPLEQALELDADGTVGVAETALIDLAVCYIHASDATSAQELLRRHIDTYPMGELHCKAQYLLGASHLAIMFEAEVAAEELAESNDEAGAATARERAILARREAIVAWDYFEAEDGKAPCGDPECEWSGYALGALVELRAADAYAGIEGKVNAAVEAGNYMEAVKELRGFVKIKDLEGTDASCAAEYFIGECLLKAGKRDEALKQWNGLSNRPNDQPCGTSQWRGEAMQAMQAARGQ